MKLSDTDALLVVDVQNDFCPGGKLAVPSGDEVVGVINRLMPRFRLVFATQDFHPPGHSSFSEQGGPWPEHCVQGTPGADFHPELEVGHANEVVQKGTDPAMDGYSGFAGTGLAELLLRNGVERVVVTGLATDYCVRATTLEALEHGFAAALVTGAVEEMRKAGATLIASDELDS